MDKTEVNALADWIQKRLRSDGEIRRALAIYLCLNNQPKSVISKLTGYKKKEIDKWLYRFQERGVEGFHDKTRKKSILSKGQDTKSEWLTDELGHVKDQPELALVYDLKPVDDDLSVSEETPESEDSDVIETDPESENIQVEKESGLHQTTRDIEAPQPITTQSTIGATWSVIEPEDTTDPVEHLQGEFLLGFHGWKLQGVSRRGKMHAHFGKYREDAFVIHTFNQWNFFAIADGAGSASLSRVGSKVVVDAAFKGFGDSVKDDPDFATDKKARLALLASLKRARQALEEEAKSRKLPIRELATTLLILASCESENELMVGTAQIGDGLLVGWDKENRPRILAQPDQGLYSGETEFLVTVPVSAFDERVLVKTFPIDEFNYLIGMTDGIADDFLPVDQNLSKLVEHFPDVFSGNEDQIIKILLDLIDYPRRGSSDDRTLIVFRKTPIDQEIKANYGS